MTEVTVADVAEPNDTTEMGLLRKELYDCMEHVRSFRAGNTSLLKALMAAHEDTDDANALRTSVLLEAGMLNADGSCNWPAIEARADSRWSWRDTVTMMIKDPQQAAKLLLMDEEDQALPFGGPELLHMARTLCAGIERLPASTHATTLSMHAAGVAHALQQLQATGDFYWPRAA